jgi:hypothetical protein
MAWCTTISVKRRPPGEGVETRTARRKVEKAETVYYNGPNSVDPRINYPRVFMSCSEAFCVV